jgi:formylmethanofuran dehydrogenase subunit D
VKCILNTGRSISQGVSVECKDSEEYRSVVSVCLLNTLDMLVLGIEDGARVRISSPVGHVVLTAQSDEGIARGEIFMTIGPYANHVVLSETHGTGMPDFKNQSVEVEPTDLPVLSVGELMEEMGGLRYENQ